MKILVVDDERTIREVLKEILEEEGYTVFTESLGSRVIDKVKEVLPDLIILDLFLPGTPGMEVLEELNRLGITRKIPVLIISGHGTVETAVKAMKLNAYDFIEKPIKYDDFLEVVKRALNSRKESSEDFLSEDFLSLPLKAAKERFEKLYIEKVLRKFNGDLKKSASFMEIDISNLYRKLNKHSIPYKDERKGRKGD